MEVGVYVYLTSPKPFFGTSRFGVRCISSSSSSKWLSVETATAKSFSKSHAAPRLIPLLCVCVHATCTRSQATRLHSAGKFLSRRCAVMLVRRYMQRRVGVSGDALGGVWEYPRRTEKIGFG